MVIHYSILAWRIPWTEEPGELYIVHGVAKELDMTEQLTHTHKPAYPHLWGRKKKTTDYERECVRYGI